LGLPYLYRLTVGAWAQWHFSRWVRRVVKYMMSVRPPPKRSAQERAEQKKASSIPQAARFRDVFPGLLRIYLPSYTPHDVEIAPGMQVLADKYSEMALQTFSIQTSSLETP